jgi:hypothetical protein
VRISTKLTARLLLASLLLSTVLMPVSAAQQNTTQPYDSAQTAGTPDTTAPVVTPPPAVMMPGGPGYAGNGSTDQGGGLNLDGIASSLENFGSGGITGMFPAISGGIALLQGASSFIGMIPGMSGIADAINKFLDFASGANASIAPIIAVAKTVGHYMRLVSGGQKTLEGLFNVRSLDDATNAINELTGLAGQAGLVDPNTLKNDPAAAAEQIAQTFDTQIQATQRQRSKYAGSPAIQSVIDARISRLKDLRQLSMRSVNRQARVKDIKQNDKSAADLASSTAESAMTLTTAAATVTNEKDAAKINVAATTQVANAVASGLANVSDQLTQQAALTVDTNEGLDQLVQQSVAQASARQAKYEADLMNDDLQAREKFWATQQIGMVTTNALAHTLTPKNADGLNFADVLKAKK